MDLPSREGLPTNCLNQKVAVVPLAHTLQPVQPLISSTLLHTFALDGGVGMSPLVLPPPLLTLTLSVALPLAPLESHALTLTLCVPVLMLTDRLMLEEEKVCL